MKNAALIFLLLYSSAALANIRQWKDAKVVKISSESGGAAALPIGGMVVAVPLTKTFYYLETEDTVYILGPASKRLDVTLYGKTKIAIEGRNAHVLDDEGKDRKMRCIQ